jgi:N-dimethylarginine dimethylaminohydrolase
MCAPERFGIEYEINPWMSLARQADRGRAKEQWEALYGFLADELKVDVHLVAQAPGLPDMVFTANAGPALEARGYCVHEFDMSEFIKAGGATKCLVLRLMQTQTTTNGYK